MRLLLSAVEPSSDRLGAALLDALGPVEAMGIGGEGMAARGMQILATPHAVMGVGELFGKLRQIRHNRQVLLDAPRPDLFVSIDAADFHLPVAAAWRARGVRCVHWVSPQLWAWRRGRAARIARSVDQLLCLFPFEPPLYAGTGLDARFVGHPVIDRVGPSRREPGVLALFPGSRASELSRHLGPFLAAAEGWKTVLLARAPGATLPPLPPHVQVVSTEEALGRADRALSKSGTVTLELTLAGIPTVVAHRVHPLTYALGRLLVRGVSHIALPNILLGRGAVPEYVQHFTPDGLAAAVAAAPEPPTAEVRALLGQSGVAARVAAMLREEGPARMPRG